MSKVQFVLNKDKLPQFLKNIRQEILNIQSGEARWRTGPPIHFETDKAVPIHATLERFQENPTKKTFDAFIAQASQDLGKPTGDGFKTWGQGLFNTVRDGKPTPTPSKSFQAKLFDGMYSCFKVARIQLEPKQIEQFEKATAQLAKTLAEEIHKEMRLQLKETIAKMKTAEAPKKEVMIKDQEELAQRT
jgi:hypothetical protein